MQYLPYVLGGAPVAKRFDQYRLCGVMANMTRKAIVVTGAAGFLGSAITVDLARDDDIVAIDQRKPSDALLRAAGDTTWHQIDIADREAVNSVFPRTRRMFGHIDSVIHFAAFYHFGTRWKSEYERTNLRGTSNVLEAAMTNGWVFSIGFRQCWNAFRRIGVRGSISIGCEVVDNTPTCSGGLARGTLETYAHTVRAKDTMTSRRR